jgi:hypothetical protein
MGHAREAREPRSRIPHVARSIVKRDAILSPIVAVGRDFNCWLYQVDLLPIT